MKTANKPTDNKKPRRVAVYCRVGTAEQLDRIKPTDYSIDIKDYFGKDIKIYPHYSTYQSIDYAGQRVMMPSIGFTIREDGIDQPFAMLTKDFGEFIGLKNCAYIDTNNCVFSEELLRLGIAADTGLYKESGFCRYPLWRFDDSFLEKIGGEEYLRYSEMYDDYMRDHSTEDTEQEPDDDDITMGTITQ